MLFELRSRRGSSLALGAVSEGCHARGRWDGYIFFQLPPDQAPTVAVLPFPCLSDLLAFTTCKEIAPGRLRTPGRSLGRAWRASPSPGSCPPLPCSSVSSCDSPTAQRCPGLTPACLAFPRSTFPSKNARVGQGLLAAVPPLLPRAASSLEGSLAFQRPPMLFHSLCTHQLTQCAALPLSLLLQAGKLRHGAGSSAAPLLPAVPCNSFSQQKGTND